MRQALKIATLLVGFLASAMVPPPSRAATIHVPGDLPQIQSAIEAANSGDVVLVAPGTYTERLDFLGKAITVRSAAGPALTVLDASGIHPTPNRAPQRRERRFASDGRMEILDAESGRVVVDVTGRSLAESITGGGPVVLFTNGEPREAVLEGFTITGGEGGVRIEQGAAPTVRNNVITGNMACVSGTGVSISFSSPLVENNVISNNRGTFGCSGASGGGISIGGVAAAIVRGNYIAGNWQTFGGGISLNAAGTPTISHNFLVGNTGSAFDIANHSDALIAQNVIRENSAGVTWTVPSGSRGPYLINNTIVRNVFHDLRADGFDVEARVVGNLIVAADGGTAVICQNFNDPNPPVIEANNVFAPNGTTYSGICGDPTGTSGNISADPLFADLDAGNLRLLAGSPSIDAGDAFQPGLGSRDLDRFPRIVDGDGNRIPDVDQGAYEFQGNLLVFADGFESGDTAAWAEESLWSLPPAAR